MRFTYDDAVAARYPAVAGGAIHAIGVANGPTPDALRAAYAAEQAATLARLGATPLSEVPSLAAWRRAFRAFGVDPTAYRSAGEALLRRLTKQGEIPSINTLVDLGNLVSIRHALPVAIMDQARMTGGTTVRFADGDEAFTDLGSGTTERPEPGEVIFVDEAGLVSARRWCWRQAAESAAQPATTEILVTVEAQHDGGATDVAAALADLEDLLRTFAGAETLVTGTVDATRRAFAGLPEV